MREVMKLYLQGDINNFDAAMKLLATLHPAGWSGRPGHPLPGGRRLIFSQDPFLKKEPNLSSWDVRGQWTVPALDPQGNTIPDQADRPWAGIEAYEVREGWVTVLGLDGYQHDLPDYPRGQIGPAFDEFCRMLAQELKLQPEPEETFSLAEIPEFSSAAQQNDEPWTCLPPGRDREIARLALLGMAPREIKPELKNLYPGLSEWEVQTISNHLTSIRKKYPGLLPETGKKAGKSGKKAGRNTH